MSALDELLVGLGYDYDPEDLNKFEKDLESTTDSIKSLVSIAAAGAAALTAMAFASTSATDAQGKLADELDETIGMIEALEFAGKRVGAEGIGESLRSLSKVVGEASRGIGTGVEAFSMLGISVRDSNGQIKKSSDIMFEISQRFQGLSRSRQIELAEKLGLSSSIRLLQQGEDGIRALVSEAEALGVATDKDASVAAEFQDSLTDLFQIIKDGSRLLSTALAPILTEAVGKFTEWWKSNRDIISTKLPEWIEQVAKYLRLASIFMGIFIGAKILGTIGSMITLMKDLSVSLMMVNGAATLLPALIVAAILAIAALAEDAKVFFEGGESFIGDMIEKFPQWADEIRVVARLFKGIADITSMIFEGWGMIFDLISQIEFPDFEGIFGKASQLFSFGDSAGSANVNETSSIINNRRSMSVDRIDISIQGGADTADNIAGAVVKKFQQASEDLDTVVDQ